MIIQGFEFDDSDEMRLIIEVELSKLPKPLTADAVRARGFEMLKEDKSKYDWCAGYNMASIN